MKKKFLFAALLAAMLASCADHDGGTQLVVQSPLEELAIPGSTPVTFNAYSNRGVTRAGQTGSLVIDNLRKSAENDGGFGVFAYYTDLKKYDQTYIPNLMYNQGVFDANAGAGDASWTYTPVVYWPNEYGSYATSDDEDKVSFFAYAPYVEELSAAGGSVEDATYGITGFSRNTTAGDPVVKYIASFNASKSVDLCWGVCNATSWAKIQGGGTQTMTQGLPWLDVEHPRTTSQRMTFTFKHALSQLNVQIDADPDIETHNTTKEIGTLPSGNVENDGKTLTKVYVRSISFTGIAMQGALNLNNTIPNTAQWLDYSGTTDLAYGQSVTVNDGRRDGREGAAGAAATNELPQGLNPAIIQNSSETTGVTHKLQNLFQPLDDNAAADPGQPTDVEIEAALNDPVYVIPTGEAMTVTIVYDVETESPDLMGYLSDGFTHGSSIENRISKTITFDEEGKGLESGKKYILKLHLGMNSVKFAAEVSDWEEADSGEGWMPANTTVRISGVSAQAFTQPVAPTRGATRGVSEGESKINVSFTSGDAFGLYVMDAEGAKLQNVRVDYNGSGLSTESPIPYSSSYQYYLYYPYSSSAPKTLSVGGGTAEEFFAEHIADFTPAADQSTQEKMMQQMLMVGKGSVGLTNANPIGANISFTLSQTQSLIQLTDHKYSTAAGYSWVIADTDFSSATVKPYNKNGILYYVAKPDANSVTFDITTPKTVNTSSTSKGNYVADIITEENYTLEVGDLMCDDGSLWKTDGTTAYQKIVNYNNTYGTSLKPIGIVFKVGTSATDSSAGYANGYVMSLYSANSGKKVDNWATGTSDEWQLLTNAEEYCNSSVKETQWTNVTTDLDGYTHCKTATNNFATYVGSDGTTLTAISAAQKNNIIGSTSPKNCTAWYLPSIGQLYEFVKNLSGSSEVADLQEWTWRLGSNDFYLNKNLDDRVVAAEIANAINEKIAETGLSPLYNDGNNTLTYLPGKFQSFSKNSSTTDISAVGDYIYFWSSTERTKDVCFILYFGGASAGGNLFLGAIPGRTKNSTDLQVRPVLAF